MDKNTYKKLIDEFTEECPRKNEYCSLRELMVHLAKDPRILIQIKCVEKYKFDRSKELGKDLGWSGAFEEWVVRGYAQKFAEVYSEEKSIKTTYSECINSKSK